MPIHSKNKGNSYELKIVKLFKSLGYNNCTTSRLTSREQDNLKVDLCGTGFLNIQCKAVEKIGSYHTILASMPEGEHNVLFHKRNRQGSVVVMKEETFIYLVKLLLDNKLLDTNV